MVLGEITTDDVRRLPDGRPRHRPRHRLHAGGLRLRLPDLRHAGLGQGAVARHRPGRRRRARGPRRRGSGARARRRRPGDDVRVRLPRDAGADAAADRARAPHGAPARRGPQVRPAAVPPARRQDPGHRRVRARRARSGSGRSSSPPSTTRTSAPSGSATTSSRRSSCRSIPATLRDVRPGHARQPDGPLRDRRADGRRRPDGPQDHRRLVRRHGPPRRRRVLAARIRRRSTGPRPTPPAGSRRTSWRRASPTGSRSRSPTASASPARSRSRSSRSAPARSPTRRSSSSIERHFDLRPGIDHRRARPAPPDLPPDRRLRPLRPGRPGPARGSAPTRPRPWPPTPASPPGPRAASPSFSPGAPAGGRRSRGCHRHRSSPSTIAAPGQRTAVARARGIRLARVGRIGGPERSRQASDQVVHRARSSGGAAVARCVGHRACPTTASRPADGRLSAFSPAQRSCRSTVCSALWPSPATTSVVSRSTSTTSMTPRDGR